MQAARKAYTRDLPNYQRVSLGSQIYGLSKPFFLPFMYYFFDAFQLVIFKLMIDVTYQKFMERESGIENSQTHSKFCIELLLCRFLKTILSFVGVFCYIIQSNMEIHHPMDDDTKMQSMYRDYDVALFIF